MANNKMPGNFLGLEIEGKFVSCETSCDFNFESDLLPVSPLEEGGWEEWIQGLKRWSISLNAGMLLRMAGSGLPEVLNAFLKGTKLNIRFATTNPDMPNFIISGKVWPNTGGISSSVNSRASWNMTFKGDGPFKVEINSNLVYVLATNKENEYIQDGKNSLVGGYKNI